ncbi:hypothetical protein HN014_22385 (plasmid) [Aquimarina sp. TRL1]|uniref:hypothetical protein n=1 Tax=Aquimarina sp. (strain TRL1) TaxID=2736252 RepID=UPI00158E5586|nr:hypothetical protein [Aquimarina sp. TRL1]QKX07750.1 hypothetical protein HN014_22385 [Aquimarina sp. TRL1]
MKNLLMILSITTLILTGCSNDDDNSVDGAFLQTSTSKLTQEEQDPVTFVKTITNQVTIKVTRQNNYTGVISAKIKYVGGSDNTVYTDLEGAEIDLSEFSSLKNDEITFLVTFTGINKPQYIHFDLSAEDSEFVWNKNVSFNNRLQN